MSLILSGTDGLSDVDGTAATPAIRGTDTNTGIFFPAADTIAFAEGGAEVARFDSSGNLGIGTSSPVNLLTVQTAATGTTAGSNVIARLQSNASGRDATLQFSDNVANSSTVSMLSGATVFRQNGVESMRITSDGLVGIGTTSPNLNTNGTVLHINNGTAARAAVVHMTNAESGSGAANGLICGKWSDGTNYFFDYGSNPIILGTSGTNRVTIAANGNVGIGVVPSVPLDVNGMISAVSPNNGSTGGVRIRDAAGNPNAAYLQFVDNGITTQYAYIRGLSPNGLDFNGAARIDSNARVLIATTTAYSDGTIGMPILQWTTLVGARGGAVSRADSTGSASHLAFVNPNGLVGNITSSGTTTSYGTSSDYRLKHDIAPMTGALAKVAALKPVTYKWNADDSDGEGFIAHELAEVCPQAVVGEKDAVGADGKPIYQGIDTSFLVATLTAAIQELKAELDTVKTELAALKGTA